MEKKTPRHVILSNKHHQAWKRKKLQTIRRSLNHAYHVLSQAISQNRLNRMTYYTVTVMQEIWEGEQ